MAGGLVSVLPTLSGRPAAAALISGPLPPQVRQSAGEGGGLVLEWRRPLWYHVHLPGCFTAAVLVRSVAPPETLDESCSWNLPTVHVLLPLLLLNLQGEPRAQDSSWEGKEGDTADGTE